MKTLKSGEYVAPEAEVLTTLLENSLLTGSTWDDGSLGDGFNELYNL